MSSFCKQCSIELFGKDTRDFAGICKKGEMAAVLCEGCGYVWVDNSGKRLSEACYEEE